MGKKSIRKTHEQFLQDVYSKYGNKYTILEKYIDAKTKILVKNNICNHEWKISPNNLLNRTNLEILCSNNHIFNRILSNFNKNQTCPKCKKENNLHKLTTSINEVINEIKLYNFKIIRWINEYRNGNSEFELECPNGHIYKTKVKYFRQHHSCPYCSQRIKPNFSFIKQEFFNRNLILLSTSYKNNKTKLSFICPNHNDIIQYIDWYHFYYRKQGCKYCSYEILGNNKKLNQDFVFNVFKSKGLMVLEGEKYIQNDIPIKFICIKHPFIIQDTAYNKIKNENNYGCIYCSYEARKRKNHYNWKGGISPLNYYLREHIIPWKENSYKLSNGKCVISNKKTKIIHHLFPFNKILEILFNETNLPIYQEINKYTEEQLKLLENKCLEIHYRYPLGVCLSKELHKEFHKKYGQKDFTPENFQEFYFEKTGKFFEFKYINN